MENSSRVFNLEECEEALFFLPLEPTSNTYIWNLKKKKKKKGSEEPRGRTGIKTQT